MNTEILACPVCGMNLELNGRTIRCVKGHSFDLAANGYANLLLSRDKHSRDPGDNAGMVRARKRFLEKGYYEPLAEGLAQTAASLLTGEGRGKSPVILDAGCGEGYYTHFIYGCLRERGIQPRVTGLDISRDAVKAAAKKAGPDFFVASLFKMPIRDNAADLILNIFAPACDGEFARVLKKDGRLVAVIPGKRHLYSLKSILYDSPYENDEKEPGLPSFRLLDRKRIQGIIDVSGDSALDLLSMTPYYWRTPEEGVNRLKEIDSLTAEIEFLILVYGRYS